MPASRYDIRIEAWADWFLSLTWLEADGETPVDLTDYEAKLQVRQLYTDEEALLTLTSEVDEGIVLGGAAGTIEIHATAAQTALLPLAEKGTLPCYYDLRMTAPGSPGIATRLIEGRCRAVSAAARDEEEP